MSRMKEHLAECQELADHWMNLANRTDAYGGYNGNGPTTRKAEYAGSWVPLHEALTLHFAGEEPIGLHSTSTDNRCKWLAWDLDSHDGNGGLPNMVAALEICKRLTDRGYKGTIFESDDRGGLHVWCMLREPIDAMYAYDIAHAVAEGFRVEAFPKQPQIRDGGFGNWIRVPGGTHPKTGYRSRVWLGDRWGNEAETMEALRLTT